MLDLPIHMSAALGVESPTTFEILSVAAEEHVLIRNGFRISGSDFAEAIESAIQFPLKVELIPTTKSAKKWGYSEVTCSEGGLCIAAFTLANADIFPPTAVGKFLARCWFEDSKIVQDGDIIRDRLVIGANAKLELSELGCKILHQWAEVYHFFELSAVAPHWTAYQALDINSKGRLCDKNTVTANLFLEAMSETKARWRFLSLYRILEHGYLTNVLKRLNDTFFSSPADSVDAAKRDISSEIGQLMSLAESSSLDQEFGLFDEEFRSAVRNGNKFAIAIEYSANKNGQLKDVKIGWKQGVVFFYKIRCAIVHAGSSSPTFEAYADGNELLNSLMFVSEMLIIKFLGITVS